MNGWSLFFSVCLIHIEMMDVHGTIGMKDEGYDQVFVDRYLFSPYRNESNGWTVLNNIRTIWQIQSMDENFAQSSDRIWFLAESEKMNSSYGFYWMSLFDQRRFQLIDQISVKSNGSFLLPLSGIGEGNLALISPLDVQILHCDQSNGIDCQLIKTIPFPSSISNRTKKISSGLFVNEKGLNGWLYIGCDTGLHALDFNDFQWMIYLNEINVSVSSMALTKKYRRIFFGTETKLWIENYQMNRSEWRFEHVNGLIDQSIDSLIYHESLDQLWIGQSTGITLLSPIRMSNGLIHWYFTRLDGFSSSPGSFIGHLPFGNITCLTVFNGNSSDQSILLGSIYGLMRFNSNEMAWNQWRLFNSGRYLPNRDEQVNISSMTILPHSPSILNSTRNSFVAVTNRGLAVIYFQNWTLEKKAEYFQKFIDEDDRHVKHGFVSDCRMSSWADRRTCVKQANDNDGLWTSMYLSSQIFRYVITNDSSVRNQSLFHFQSLYLLNQVTGIVGYPARSLALKSESPSGDDWYPSPFNTSLEFKGDTSSDEIVGHEYVYPLVYQYLAKTSEERSKALELIFNISNHLLTHQLYLIGEKGEHTTWGIWNPKEINNDSFYQETRGLNSLQIFAFLFQSYAFTFDQRFLDEIQQLIDRDQYDVNLINQKMISLCDGDFSDDELAYLAYFNLYFAFYTIESSYSEMNDQLREYLQNLIEHLYEYLLIGLNLSHQYKRMEKSPFYNFIYCFVSGQTSLHLKFLSKSFVDRIDCQSLINDSIWYLQRWPLDLINYPQYNALRLDININDLKSKCGSKYSILSRELLPPDERSTHKWNGGQFDLNDGDGFTEEDPTSFLLSYWGMRFFQLIDN